MSRQTAVHALCCELSAGSFVRGSVESSEASFVESNGERFSRVCLAGRAVERSFGRAGEATLTVDDGSGQVNAVAATPHAQQCLQAVNKGELILVIGKLREGQERFVAAEIARVLYQPEWFDLHLSRVRLRQTAVSKVKSVA